MKLKMKLALTSVLLALSPLVATAAGTNTTLLTINSIEARSTGVYDIYFNETSEVAEFNAIEGCSQNDRFGLNVKDVASQGMLDTMILAAQKGWNVRLKIDGCVTPAAIQRGRIAKVRLYIPAM